MIKLKSLILENVIKKPYGYISFNPTSSKFGGIPKIETFVIYEKYRNKGYARKLAKFLPEHCWLQAEPLANMPGIKLNKQQLIAFYKSIGFIKYFDKNTLQTLMYR
jgi:GNAT superfamily N-acetyltransferase